MFWWTCFSKDNRFSYWKPTMLIWSSCRLVRYSYEADFIQGLLRKNGKLVQSFNFTLRYIDHSLWLHNSKFGDYVNSIYPIEIEIKDTTGTARSASSFPDSWLSTGFVIRVTQHVQLVEKELPTLPELMSSYRFYGIRIALSSFLCKGL